MKSKLIVASIAFSVVASALPAADKPKPWAKKFTMSREECYQRKHKWRNEHAVGMRVGGPGGGFSNLTATDEHDYDSWKPSWWVKCTDRYGHL